MVVNLAALTTIRRASFLSEGNLPCNRYESKGDRQSHVKLLFNTIRLFTSIAGVFR